MARNLSSRILIKGTLVAVCPVHVGGISHDSEIDLALAIDGQGRFYIPGTSLAGTLRAWMTAAGDKKTIDFLWGALLEDTKQPNHASFILVEDAPITCVDAEVRDGVGIDRVLGAAAERVKYDQAILPKGTQIPLEMTVELQESNTDLYEALLRDLLEALQNKHLRLGASKTRGMGRVELRHLSICQQTLNTTDGMLKALRQQGEGISVQDLSTSDSLKPRPKLTLTIAWKPIGSLMVKEESDGIAIDHLPLVSAVDENNLAFVLPGSSIKGSLRTQAERIVRTVKQRETPDSNDLSRRFMDQLEQDSLITALFGRAAKVERNGKVKQVGHIGALAVDDCYAQSNIDAQVWNRIASAKTSEDLYKELNVPLPNTQQGFHVAIDRWTGGAADGLLYSTLEPMGIVWEPVTINLDLHQLRDNWKLFRERHQGQPENAQNEYQQEQLASLALLLLVLRDMMSGRIPLGYGTNRGMGAIAINHIHISGHQLPEEWASLQDVTLSSDSFQALDANLMRSLQTAWTTWINAPSKDESQVEATA